MRITFLGAAGTVTGSKFLVSTGTRNILVDCGLFQGLKTLRLRNWRPFPIEPSTIDAVVLTHAHLDHTGYLPVLVRHGFNGPIYCTPATQDLCNILLPDSGRIQEEDAVYANRKAFSRHDPALPLYTEADAHAVAPRLLPAGFNQTFEIGDLAVRYSRAGHILGAASVRIECDDGAVLFSGDIGRQRDLMLAPPEPPQPCDWLVMESTYGDRTHSTADPMSALADVVRRTFARDGVLLVPAFAVGRAQTVLYALHKLFDAGALPRAPVFLNSPMASDVTELYHKYSDDHIVPPLECAATFEAVNIVQSVKESKALNERRGPMIIVAGAGMLTGGRILHHLRAFGNDHRNTILLAGYQAPGTRGDALLRGERALRMHGGLVPIRAEVVQLDGFSGHADQVELMAWLRAFPERPREVFLAHGEPVSLDTLRQRIQSELSLRATVAEDEGVYDVSRTIATTSRA